ncbi:4Fe-4S binding protein [Bacteroidota bacterium]
MQKNKRSDIFLLIFVFATICLAYFMGSQITQDTNTALIKNKFPLVENIQSISNELYSVKGNSGIQNYFSIGESGGYNGPLKSIIVTDSSGIILTVEILDHKETDSYLKKVIKNRFLEAFKNKGSDQFEEFGKIDAVSGATKTCDGIRYGVMEAVSNLAHTEFDIELPDPKEPGIVFGLAEILLVILMIFGIVARTKQFKYKKTARWISIMAGMIIFGFLLNIPLTIGKLNTFLLGYQSHWQENIFWYILIFGIIIILFFTNKNSYCQWICPFGASQDCIGVIGNAKTLKLTSSRKIFNYLPGFLSWLAIITALIFRNPGASSYEVFGAFFKITGSIILFVLLGIVLITSLFIKRPWCDFLCPVNPVFVYIRKLRNLILEPWRKK